MPSPDQRIGDAAAALGVAPHVLRHWEDVGLLLPNRLPTGHRVYDEETRSRARVIQIAQRAGLSLAEIRNLAHGDRDARIALIEEKRMAIAEQIADLRLADKFLAHVVTCEHPVISECPTCSRIVTEPQVGRIAPTPVRFGT